MSLLVRYSKLVESPIFTPSTWPIFYTYRYRRIYLLHQRLIILMLSLSMLSHRSNIAPNDMSLDVKPISGLQNLMAALRVLEVIEGVFF